MPRRKKLKKNIIFNKFTQKPTEDEVRENLLLLADGKPLSVPLKRLNKSFEFREKSLFMGDSGKRLVNEDSSGRKFDKMKGIADSLRILADELEWLV